MVMLSKHPEKIKSESKGRSHTIVLIYVMIEYKKIKNTFYGCGIIYVMTKTKNV